MGYSPWGCKESDTTERLSVCARTHTHRHLNKDDSKTQSPHRISAHRIFHPGGGGGRDMKQMNKRPRAGGRHAKENLPGKEVSFVARS